MPSSSRKYSAAVRAVRPTRARTRRLVHLAIDEGGLVEHRRAVCELRVRHLVPEVIALASALADSAEHRVAAVLLRDVVDEFEDDDGLAHTGTAEETDLASLRVRRDQVDDLDTGLEGLHVNALLFKAGGVTVNRTGDVGVDRTALIYRPPHHV